MLISTSDRISVLRSVFGALHVIKVIDGRDDCQNKIARLCLLVINNTLTSQFFDSLHQS